MVIPIAHVSMFNGDLSFQGRSYPADDELGAFPKGVADLVGPWSVAGRGLPPPSTKLDQCARSRDAYDALPPLSQYATERAFGDHRSSPPRSPSPPPRCMTRAAYTTLCSQHTSRFGRLIRTRQ